MFQSVSSQIHVSSWSTKSSKTSRSVPMRSRLRHQSDESDSTSISVRSKSSHSFQTMSQPAPRPKVASTNSSTSYKPIMPSSDNAPTDTQPRRQTHSAYQQQQPQLHQQQDQQMTQKLKVEQQHCSDFVEPTQFSTESMETVVGGSYSGTTDPSLISLLQTTEVMYTSSYVLS